MREGWHHALSSLISTLLRPAPGLPPVRDRRVRPARSRTGRRRLSGDRVPKLVPMTSNALRAQQCAQCYTRPVMSENVRTSAKRPLHEVLAKNREATRELALDVRARALARAAGLPEEELEPLLEIIDLVTQRQVSAETLSATARVLHDADWAGPAKRKPVAPANADAELELASRIRSALFEEAVLASCVTAQEAAARLGVARSTIEKLPEAGVLALGGPGRGRRYPAWQFQKGQPERTVPGLGQVLEALEGTPLRKAVWLSTPREVWDHRAASDLLQEGDYRRVLELAQADSIPV